MVIGEVIWSLLTKLVLYEEGKQAKKSRQIINHLNALKKDIESTDHTIGGK